MPKEIKSTLPPLQLTPNPQASASSPNLRPELKSHTTTPLPDKPGWETESTKVASATHTPSMAAVGAGAVTGLGVGVVGAAALASPTENLDLGHNAWGDEDGEIQMTFA